MAEDLYINAGSKTEKYRALLPQLKNLLAGEDDLIANLANVSAALKETFHFFWVGFYLVKGEELVLGPFQGLPEYPPHRARNHDEHPDEEGVGHGGVDTLGAGIPLASHPDFL